MSRPRPQILMSVTDPKTYKADQILLANAIYAVFYDGKAINLRTVNSLIDLPAKYKKVSFSNSGHAFNLSEKLNKLFKTDLFYVVSLTGGEKITENK